MTDAERDRLGTGSAADLLSSWRAAERDLSAAQDAASVASLAGIAASEAATAARETAEAARLSLEASVRAEDAARRTAEAAELAFKMATGEQRTADEAVVEKQAAEAEARERFQEAQRRGFPRTE